MLAPREAWGPQTDGSICCCESDPSAVGEPRYTASRVAHNGIYLYTFSFVIRAIWEGRKEACSLWDAFMRMYACVLSHFKSCPTLTLWTVACQALLSSGFSRQEYWSGLPCPPPGDLPDSGVEPSLLQLLRCRRILHR